MTSIDERLGALRVALVVMDDAVMDLGRVMLREEAKAPADRDFAAIGEAVAMALNTHVAAKRALAIEREAQR